MTDIIPTNLIETRIIQLRGHKVLLDQDLAELYGVTTKTFNQAVKRNIGRFPPDFMFLLSPEEADFLRSQIVTSKMLSVTYQQEDGRGGRRTQPFAFTEHGVAMLSSVLKSERAIQVNIAIIRAFTRLRQFLATHQDLAQKLEELEAKYDDQFREVFEAIYALMDVKEEEKPKRLMGFVKED
jgi:phage regulator Rha-like protein